MDNHQEGQKAQDNGETSNWQDKRDRRTAGRLYLLGIVHLSAVVIFLDQAVQESWSLGVTSVVILAAVTVTVIMPMAASLIFRLDTELGRQAAALVRIHAAGVCVHTVFLYLALVLLLTHGWDAWIMFALLLAAATITVLTAKANAVERAYRRLQLNTSC